MARRVSHIPRSLRLLEEAFPAKQIEVVESWQSAGAGNWVRKDLFGFIDIEAWDVVSDVDKSTAVLRMGNVNMIELYGIQVCSASTRAAHRRKMLEHENWERAKTRYAGIGLLAWRKPKHRWLWDLEVLHGELDL